MSFCIYRTVDKASRAIIYGIVNYDTTVYLSQFLEFKGVLPALRRVTVVLNHKDFIIEARHPVLRNPVCFIISAEFSIEKNLWTIIFRPIVADVEFFRLAFISGQDVVYAS